MSLTAELALLNNLFLRLFPTTTASRWDTWHTPRCRFEFTRSDLAGLRHCSAWLPGEGLLSEGQEEKEDLSSGAAGSRLAGRTAHHAGGQFHKPHQEPAALAVIQTAEEPDGEPRQQGTFTLCAL